MGFWQKLGEFIFDKTIIIYDDFFGEMIDCDTYFECQKLFKPTGKIVVLHINKVNEGISINQKDFFINLEKNYDQLIQNVSPMLEEKVNGWIKRYKIKDFKSEFILDFISIPQIGANSFEWQIAFDAINDLQHSCFLTMNGNRVTNIHIDG